MISDELASIDQQLQAAEQDVERASAALKKELRLVDLVSIQILNIVGLFWVGTAGKLGSSQVMFWIPGVLLFYIRLSGVESSLAKPVNEEEGSEFFPVPVRVILAILTDGIDVRFLESG